MRERGAPEPVRLVEVELDDDETVPSTRPDVPAPDDVASSVGYDDRHDGAASPRWRTPARWAAGGVVAALAVAAVVANVVEVHEDRTRAERLAGQPGVVASFADPLTVRWRSEGYLAADLGDRLLIETPGGMSAVDAATGEVVWSLDPGPTPTSYCQVLTDDDGWGPTSSTATTDADTLVCVGEGAVDASGIPAAPLLVVDVATGDVRARLPLPSAVLSVEPAGGGDVLVVSAEPSGALLVTRWDTATGERRWDVLSAARPFRPSSGGADTQGWARSDDVLRVTGSRGDVVVDLAAGRELDPGVAPDVPDARWTIDLPDGSTAVWAWEQGGSGEVLEPDGSVRFALPAPVLRPAIDDGAVPGVLLVDDGGLRALDLATGDELWSRELTVVGSLVQVDGVLAGPSSSGVVGLDLRTGELLWEAGVATGAGYTGGLTDGSRLLTAEYADARHEVVARDLRTGAARWSLPFDQPVQAVVPAAAGGVLVMTQDAVVGLG